MSLILRKFHERSFAAVTGWVYPQEMTPFVIPNLERDHAYRIVLTTVLASLHPNPRVAAMATTASRFFAQVAKAADAASAGDVSAGILLEQLLSCGERPEIRSGYSVIGHEGSGIGRRKLGAQLRDEILCNPALRATLVIEPDALQLIPNIGPDRVTDFLATVILGDLIRYTQSFLPRFNDSCLADHTWHNVYNGSTGLIDATLTATVPVDDHGNPIILLPKEIVRGSMALCASDFRDPSAVGTDNHSALSKRELLDQLRLDPEKLTNYVTARLHGVKQHTKFQDGKKRRRRPMR